MVINKLQIELDKIRRNGLTIAIIIAIISTVWFSIFSKYLIDAQINTIFIELPLMWLFISLKAMKVLKNPELNTPYNIATLKGTSFGVTRLIILIGGLASAMIFGMLINNKFNGSEIFGFAIPFIMNLFFIFIICSGNRNTLAIKQPQNIDEPSAPIKGIDFNDSMHRTNTWFSDGAHPLSFTNPVSPNFPGAHSRQDW